MHFLCSALLLHIVLSDSNIPLAVVFGNIIYGVLFSTTNRGGWPILSKNRLDFNKKA
jgi:hypothetical protein